MAVTTKTRTRTLAEFYCTHLFVITEVSPVGKTIDLTIDDNPDGIPFDLARVVGTVDRDGVFRWDRQTQLLDLDNNRVRYISAWSEAD